MTPLMTACAMHSFEMVDLLLSHGADVSRLDSHHRHCLDYFFAARSDDDNLSGTLFPSYPPLIHMSRDWPSELSSPSLLPKLGIVAFPPSSTEVLILITTDSFDTLRESNAYKRCKSLVERILASPGGSNLLNGSPEKPNLGNLAVSNRDSILLLLAYDLNLDMNHKTHGITPHSL